MRNWLVVKEEQQVETRLAAETVSTGATVVEGAALVRLATESLEAEAVLAGAALEAAMAASRTLHRSSSTVPWVESLLSPRPALDRCRPHPECQTASLSGPAYGWTSWNRGT